MLELLGRCIAGWFTWIERPARTRHSWRSRADVQVKVARKAMLEDGPSVLKPGGNRSAVQVSVSLTLSPRRRHGRAPSAHAPPPSPAIKPALQHGI